jgi:thiol-disulfide isomerase/thioredoxin
MSEDQSPQNAASKKSGTNPILIAVVVLGLGLVAGAGLYALLGDKSNSANTVAAAGDTASTCPVDETLRAELDAAAGGHVAAFKAVDRPYSVKTFAFNDIDGNPKTFADWNGKTVLFNLWATWCAPCRAEMPALEALNKELGSDAFEVVPVSVDLGDPGRPKGFYEEIGLKDMGFYHDPELATLNALKREGLAFGLPATLLISKQGCVLGTLNGPAEWASDDAKKLINAALKQ